MGGKKVLEDLKTQILNMVKKYDFPENIFYCMGIFQSAAGDMMEHAINITTDNFIQIKDHNRHKNNLRDKLIRYCGLCLRFLEERKYNNKKVEEIFDECVNIMLCNLDNLDLIASIGFMSRLIGENFSLAYAIHNGDIYFKRQLEFNQNILFMCNYGIEILMKKFGDLEIRGQTCEARESVARDVRPRGK